ncbi:hypothetical protein P43SY_001780 [Pythium insidiosum]|uniref:Uncharacterized protein n=1 Tax=Pythium insidiosum TaxID=114742 RepID=A0AAD5LUL5_PYTIN|nr:hypothetical protein P43SY_001780 [Pythium insidiosum]
MEAKETLPRRWNASTNRSSHGRRESLTGTSLLSLKTYYRKLRTFKGTVKALINLRLAPKAVEAVVKLVDDDEALHKVQTQVKSLAEHGHVVTELDEACGEEVAYRMQGNLELYTEENLRKRLQLQQNPHLVALTQRLWLSAMQDNEEQMSYDEYEAFMLRLHRLILPEFDFDQSKDLIKDDWARDTDGSEYLDYRFFHWSMFELVDITPVDILDESKKIQLVDIQRDLHRELTSESATLYLERPTPDKA